MTAKTQGTREEQLIQDGAVSEYQDVTTTLILATAHALSVPLQQPAFKYFSEQQQNIAFCTTKKPWVHFYQGYYILYPTLCLPRL